MLCRIVLAQGAVDYFDITVAMMIRLLMSVLVVIASLQPVCTEEELVDDTLVDDTENVSMCTSQYSELEAYIENNANLLENLLKAFYQSGHVPSKFVKITYNYHLCVRHNNGLVNRSNCTYDYRIYVWSESAFYLLGPNTLCWLTLHAVCVHENSVTVQLPSLCGDVTDTLLSRLTYLV